MPRAIDAAKELQHRLGLWRDEEARRLTVLLAVDDRERVRATARYLGAAAIRFELERAAGTASHNGVPHLPLTMAVH